MFFELPHPAIFAHRGASSHAPENTLAAFELAVLQGADGIELDVRLSADGYVVVIHDPTVDRTTDGSGRISEFPLAALRVLDAGSHFDVAFKGEPIPTLDEVFTALGRQTYINVDLANYDTPFDTLPEKVAALIKRHNLARQVLVSSFNPFSLRRIHRCIPDLTIGLLALPGGKGAWARSWVGKLIVPYQSLHPNLRDVSKSLVKRIHKEACRVFVYTVTRADDMLRLCSLDVDGFFTDDPLLARRVLVAAGR